MKILCVLQNSWGGQTAPIFKPNPLNKSAKVMRKMCGPNQVIHFCNTARASAKFAHERFNTDHTHFQALIPRFAGYHLIVVCGKQAEQAYLMYKAAITAIGVPVLVTMHPASRTLTNKLVDKVARYIEGGVYAVYKNLNK